MNESEFEIRTRGGSRLGVKLNPKKTYNQKSAADSEFGRGRGSAIMILSLNDNPTYMSAKDVDDLIIMLEYYKKLAENG